MPLNAATAWLSVADPDGVDPDPEVTAEAVRVVLAELHLRISLKSEWDELLASLAERGLYWVPAGDGGKGHLREGPEEPPVGAVVLDQDGDAWQNRRTGVWRPVGSDAEYTWADLRRVYGPVVLLTADSAAAADDQQDRS